MTFHKAPFCCTHTQKKCGRRLFILELRTQIPRGLRKINEGCSWCEQQRVVGTGANQKVGALSMRQNNSAPADQAISKSQISRLSHAFSHFKPCAVPSPQKISLYKPGTGVSSQSLLHFGGGGGAMLGLHCCVWAFSSKSSRGLLPSCGLWASHCGSLFCCRAQALERTLQ